MDKSIIKKIIIGVIVLISFVFILNHFIANDTSSPPSKTSNDLEITESKTAKNEKNIRIIMKDTKYETEAYIIESMEQGPTIFINGGIHGDEIAGFKTAETLLSYNLKKGRLIILPRANKIACEENKRTADFMEDLNRQFPGKKDGNDTQKIALEITELIKEVKPDIVLDLHESRGNYRDGRLGNSIIFMPIGSTAELVMTILENINAKATEGNDFTFITNPPEGSINREIATRLNIPVLTLETSRKIDLEVRINQQLDILKEVFSYYGIEEN